MGCQRRPALKLTAVLSPSKVKSVVPGTGENSRLSLLPIQWNTGPPPMESSGEIFHAPTAVTA